MDNLLTVAFEAHQSEMNHHRRYAITIGRDLFDDWTVSIRYGRAGKTGRESRFSGSQVDELRAVVRDRLRRRLSTPRRIGCPYRMTEFTSSIGFDTSAWLPNDIMARFFIYADELPRPPQARCCPIFPHKVAILLVDEERGCCKIGHATSAFLNSSGGGIHGSFDTASS